MRDTRCNNDPSSRHWQLAYAIDLVGDLAKPLVKLAFECVWAVGIPGASMRGFSGRHFRYRLKIEWLAREETES